MNFPDPDCVPANWVKANPAEMKPAGIIPQTVASASTTSPMENRFSNREAATVPRPSTHFNPIIDSLQGFRDLHPYAMSTWD
jgi:hypothetical protein